MAKKALLDVLEQTIGKYVRNLDAESLNVAVWSGKIELNSLELDCESVNAELARQAAEAPNLAVPFRVVSGEFGNLQVDVPWSHLMSQPVKLRASGLKVAVEPFDRTASADFLHAVHASESVRARKVQEQRAKSLELADGYRKQANVLRELAEQDLEGSSSTQSSSSKKKDSSTFAARLVRRIIENIQVEISGVHVTVQGSEYSAGLMLQELSLVTTDKYYKPTFVDRTSGRDAGSTFLYKMLRISDLAVYLDGDDTKHSHLAAIGEELVADPANHSYLLAPLSFEAKLRQADSNECIDYPKYLLASELSSLSILLSRTQLELGNKIAEEIRPAEGVAVPLFPEYRPLKRVTKETAVDWWRYATRCIGRLNGRRSWVEFFRAFQRRKAYIPLHKRHAHHESCSWIKALTPEEHEQLKEIEADRSISVEGIMTWRDVADAQVKKEQQKHDAGQTRAKGSIFKSLFGGSQATSEAEDAPPISLSAAEMQELEAVTMDQIADTELSSDSRLCDVNFMLRSLRIDLSSYDERPLTSLEMGAVSTSFDANQDGSFSFNLDLTSLEIQDRVTPHTLFPEILKNQATLRDNPDQTFSLRLSKSKSGDQLLRVKLDTFEAIASPTLVSELKRFFTLSRQGAAPPKSAKVNPILTQSLSGSIDLFYDAAEGDAPTEDKLEVSSDGFQNAPQSAAMEDFSNALIDAWKTKTESKTSWVVDFDIQAPIIVVPENCTSPRANVLVFDLGHLRFQYGQADAPPRVEEWFRENPRIDSPVAGSVVDNGSLRISDLTFMVGKTNFVKRLIRKQASSGAPNDEEAVVQPISLSIDFAVESNAQDEAPRVCMIGILPSISLRISPNQLSRILKVSATWQNLLQDMSPKSEAADVTADDEVSRASTSSLRRKLQPSEGSRLAVALVSPKSAQSSSSVTHFYAAIRLKQLSIKVLNEDENGIEAHLVSVSASTSFLSDGSSSTNLSMGWFWILDRLENDFPRRQRLVAHSTLPSSADELARDDNYGIIEQLRRQGVFDDDFAGSSDLADITMKQSPPGASFGKVDPFDSEVLNGEDFDVSTILAAKFTSLYINWNPRAVKTILSALGKFAETMKSSTESEPERLILSEPAHLKRRRGLSLDSTRSGGTAKNRSESGPMLIKAEMGGFQISLNSARDDLPVFTGHMVSTSVSMVLGDSGNIRMNLLLGALKVTTPTMGKTNAEYRTILGLAEEGSDSLLSIRYYAGSRAIASISSKEGVADCEAYGEIELSPFRLVYIQAQILALVEYATAGILGALTAQAATSAKIAAAELASPAESKKVFKVTAAGMELVLPQAAYKPDSVSVSLDSLSVLYTAMPDSSSVAQICLKDVLMRGSDLEPLLEDPIRMDIKVLLPPAEVGTKDDQAMRVDLVMSKAHFVLTKPQYAQILATLDENVGEEDLFLRDESSSLVDTVEGDSVDSVNEFFGGLTHAGVEIVDDPRRIYLQITIGGLSLQLCGIDRFDPLIQLSAFDSSIQFKTFADEGKTSVQLTLRDLVCDDQRLKAMSRQYRSLIYQPESRGENDDGGRDVFFVSYESLGENSSSVDLIIGSPRIVYIPDAIADLLGFLSVDRTANSKKGDSKETVHGEKLREVVKVDDGADTGIETTFALERKPSPVSSVSFSMKTSKCTVLLVDLGSDSLRPNQGPSPSFSVPSVAETIVLGGSFEAIVSLGTSAESGEVVNMDTQFHGDAIEVYTAFGHDLHSAVQILDPTRVSLYVNIKSSAEEGKVADVRCAVITPVDLTLSMRNVALINAIVDSTSVCFDASESEPPISTSVELSQEETKRIEKLETVLETPDLDTSFHTQESTLSTAASTVSSSDFASSANTRSEVRVKLTTPEMKLTLINDLQGVDDALLRFTTSNFVANGRMGTVVRSGDQGSSFQGFDFNLHTSILADYYDSSTSTWKVLLLSPWEVSAKGSRGESQRFQSKRPSTTIDIESFQCQLSFSEQFLMSLASANQMWNVYSAASSSALESIDEVSKESKSIRRSLAASAARTFVSSLPYAVDNHAGIDMEFVINGERPERRWCSSGSVEYFRFEPPAGAGTGGKRLYGQDVKSEKTVSLLIGDRRIDFPHFDSQLGRPKAAHTLENHRLIMTDVVKEGKTTVLHVSSGVDVSNQSSIPFSISGFKDGSVHSVGVCTGMSFETARRSVSHSQSVAKDGSISKPSRIFGIPVDLVDSFRTAWAEKSEASISLALSPRIECPHEGWEWSGGTKLTVNGETFSSSPGHRISKKFDITCRPVSLTGAAIQDTPRDLYAFVLQVHVLMVLVNGTDPAIEISLEPRAVITNQLPISVSIKTPMPHVFSQYSSGSPPRGDEAILAIEPSSYMEIFTPGPSIAILLKCADPPVGGTATDWMDGGWIDLPLVSEFRMQEPLDCMFPFVKKTADPLSLAGSRGSAFVIAEGGENLANMSLRHQAASGGSGSTPSETSAVELSAPPSVDEDWRTFFITVSNYAIDHTGDILFEQLVGSREAVLRRSSTGVDKVRRSQATQVSPPIGAYSTRRHRGRISLLPGPTVPIRLLHLTMEGDEGLRRSAPFQVEDISICDGGAESTPLKWEDGELSGFFAYKQLVSSYQSEIHVIPEFVVYNGSEREIHVRQPGGADMVIESGKIAPLRTQASETPVITVELPDIGGQTRPVRIDSLGLRVAIVKSSDGASIGSLAFQTVVGARDSRFVVKLGEVKFGSLGAPGADSFNKYDTLRDDFFRFRIRWTELQLTLTEARPVTSEKQAFVEMALDRIKEASTPQLKSDSRSETWVKARGRHSEEISTSSEGDKCICTILFQRFTVDWQRVFKEGETARQGSVKEALESSERSQLSVVIHSVRIRDETPETAYPIVFDSTSNQVSLFELVLRFRGDTNAALVKVDLLDLNLAHVNGVSEKIYLNTSEDFVWKLLDLANRIIAAAAEFTGVDIALTWDEKEEGYTVAIREKETTFIEEEVKYTPPRSDRIFDIRTTRVSPFNMVVSFKRTPQASRYKRLHGVKGANLMNYVTRRLKFKIEKAELSFARYEVNNVKGPPDRIIELVSNVYLSRMKRKIVTLMTAASFQDWKFLASRQDGKDAYVEGDLFRATGNLAGSSASYVLGRTGKGIGKGVSNVASTLGEGIESATDAIGARAVGAGVNSVVSGVGSGLGETISGVGSGAGKILKGAGQGVGQVFGGVTGGALMAGKGLGKGITTGDGRAAASGIAQGAASIGAGVGQGVESVVTGATDGVLSVGHGLFTGARHVGRGIGGAFTEWCGSCCGGCGSCFGCCGGGEEEREGNSNRNSVTAPLLPRGNAAPPS